MFGSLPNVSRPHPPMSLINSIVVNGSIKLSYKVNTKHIYIKENLDRGPREDYPARG